MEPSKFNLPDFSKFKLSLPKSVMGPRDSMMNYLNHTNMESREGVLTQVDEIQASDFLDKLYGGDAILFQGNKDKITKVMGDVSIDPEKYKRKALILESFEFTGIVSFLGSPERKFNLGSKIALRNCTFFKPLIFGFCIFSDTNQNHYSQKSSALLIVNGSYILIQISNCELPFGANFYAEEGQKLEIDWFESYNNQFSKAGYDFENVTFKSKMDITSDIIENLGISFRNCISTSPLRIESVNSPGISFLGTKATFEKDIRIWGGKLSSLTWNHGIFNDEVDISSVKITKSLTISGSVFNDRVLIRRKDSGSQIRNFILPEEIWIQDSKFHNGIEFHGDVFKASKLQINFSEKSSGVIDFRNTYFKEVTLKGNNFNNSLFLRDCSYDKLTLTHLFNKSLISFNNNNPELSDGVPKELLIQNSNLGNTEFYDFDFSIYPSIRIIDSRLDNIFVNGVEWFETGLINVDENEKDEKKILSQKREIFRQLKLAAEKQSDRITALEFKSREIHTHKLYIKSKRGDNGNSFLSKQIDFCKKLTHAGLEKLNLLKLYYQTKKYLKYQSDRISINLGETNDHGQNWIKPLIWIIAITTATYPFLFILADPEINFWPEISVSGWNLFWSKFSEHSAVWPQLFNPTRRVSDLFEKIENPFRFYSLDGIQRIVLAFFIFQIVSAFRKFVK